MDNNEMERFVLEMKEVEGFMDENKASIDAIIKGIGKLQEQDKKRVLSILIERMLSKSTLTAESKVALLENLKFITFMDNFGMTMMLKDEISTRLKDGRLAEEDLGLK